MTVRLEPEAQEILDRMLTKRPAIMRAGKAEKYGRMIDLLAAKAGLAYAPRSLVIEAIKFCENKGLDPTFETLDDPTTFYRKVLGPQQDLNLYNAIPVKVRRWPTAPRQPAKPPAEQKVVAFNASPRLTGNTSAIIDEALKGAADAGAAVKKYHLQKLKMGFCLCCRKCKEPDAAPFCVIKDDLAPIYPEIMAADAIIVGFPIFTGRECSQVSTFLDRWDCFERNGYQSVLKPGRVAMVVGTWGYPNPDTYDFILEKIMIVLKLHFIETVEAVSACGFEGKLHGFDEHHQAFVKRFPDELRHAYEAGRGLVTGK
jgi:multimeric flavodoxin WrbA